MEDGMETSTGLSSLTQKLLISCGIISPLIYLGTDWLAGKVLKGYSFTAQSISELSAAGSPTRSLVVSLTLVAGLFMIAFGICVWQMSGQMLLPRIVSGLVIGNVIAGLVATIFFPNRFGERPVFGSPGVILMFFSVLFFILAMVLGAMAFGGWFRILSIAIPSTYILLAILRFATSSTGEVVSLVGAQERTMSYSFLIWVMALAIYLLLLITKGADSANAIG
jgi:hypothetical protein